MLLVAALGIWFFRTGYLPKDRELIWTVDRAEDVRAIELQLWDSDGELIKREQLPFPTGAPTTVTQTVSLGSGSYRLDGFVHFAGDPEEHHFTRTLEVKGDKQYPLRTGP